MTLTQTRTEPAGLDLIELRGVTEGDRWPAQIREALDEDRFALYAQPIVPLGDGRPSVELLLRMVAPDGRVVLPGRFLPSAERCQLIGEIDRWVIGEAARIAAQGVRVEANLSAASITHPDLLPDIEQAMRVAGSPAENLVFEITETAVMHDMDAGEAFAHGLVDMGCGVALDDFGTGFGTFTYLKRLPVHYLKIDVDFVRDLPSSDVNQLLVHAVVSLADAFGLETIAEGVEGEQTLSLLEKLGVDYAQGHFIGRPAPVSPR